MIKPRGITVAGNWKMNHGPQETESYFLQLRNRLLSSGLPSSALELNKKGQLESVLFVPAVSLAAAKAASKSVSEQQIFPNLSIGAQNAHWELKGAFTGEISGPMLQELGIHWILIGHSERRQYFGETNTSVFQRTESLLKQGFHLVVCVGETREERERGQTQDILSQQILEGISKLDHSFAASGRLTLAYEPVWAIGTGLSASPELAQEAHRLIRERLNQSLSQAVGQKMRILYGGSVTPQNAGSYFGCPDIDGILAGGASLKPNDYLSLIEIAAQTLNSSIKS